MGHKVVPVASVAPREEPWKSRWRSVIVRPEPTAMSVLRIRVSDVNFRTTHHGATRSRPRSWCRPNVRDPNKASPLSGTSFGALENARSGTSISDTGSERAIRMPKRRSQVHLNNYSGGVAKQFGGRNAGLSQSPFPDGFRQMHDYTGTQGGDDFLSRLERAEQRDSQSFAARAAPTPHELALSNPYKQAAEYQQVRQKHSGSSIVIGGSSAEGGQV